MVGLYLFFYFYESWFVFDLFFVFVIDAVPQKKKKKKDIARQGVAFLDYFLIGPRFRPQIGPKSDLVGWSPWGPWSLVGCVWAPGKKPI